MTARIEGEHFYLGDPPARVDFTGGDRFELTEATVKQVSSVIKDFRNPDPNVLRDADSPQGKAYLEKSDYSIAFLE